VAAVEDEVASFVAARRRALVRYGYLLAGETAAGEDLVQEALLRCLPSWSRLEPQGVEAYVRKVMARLAWKSRRQRVQLDSPLSENDPNLADLAESSSEQADLSRALAKLPPQQRVVLILRYWQDLDEVEIAEWLGCRQGTVKSRSSRAYAQLRKELGWTDHVPIENKSSAERRDVP
jgi:RNA polymerase sigma-70 factor (sigma-E family)